MAITKFSKQQIATALAILFHAIGLAGILIFKNDFFIRTTPLNLLLMFVLVVWTQEEKSSQFFVFIATAIIIGIVVEIIGVNTGLLFGNYNYGDVLGIKIKGVPFLIGVNWFVIVYCCGITIYTIMMLAIDRLGAEAASSKKSIKALSVIVDGATLAVFFDWIMEPVAVNLGFWKWQGNIPLYNYVCWFVISMLLLTVFYFCNFNKRNKFAVHLLLIQLMFFLLLSTFLTQ